MEKYELYVASTYIYLDTQKEALEIAKNLLSLGVNIDIKRKEVEKK